MVQQLERKVWLKSSLISAKTVNGVTLILRGWVLPYVANFVMTKSALGPQALRASGHKSLRPLTRKRAAKPFVLVGF